MAGPGGAKPVSELHLRLVWVTVFRAVAVSLILAMIALRLLTQPAWLGLSRADSLSFAVIGAVYVATLIYGLLLRAGWAGRRLAYAQIAGDVAVASALVFLTGGAESPFAFIYLVAVVVGSILLYQRGALVAAGASTALFALTLFLGELAWADAGMVTLRLVPPRLTYTLLSNVLAQFLIAALAGYLSRQLTAAGGQISEREARLASLAQLQEQILGCMPAGLITCDGSGKVTFLNRAGEQILGLDSAVPEGTLLNGVIPGMPALDKPVRRRELAVETRGGRRILGMTVTPLIAPDAGAHLIIFQDLTELRRAEEDLQRADRLAALGALSATLAHEIRNPLAAMRGSAQMLAEDPGVAQTSAKLAKIMVREADRLGTLVDDFLRFARPPAPVLKPSHLHQLIAELVELQRIDPLAQGVELELKLDEVVVEVDADQLRQVLLNIVRNALAAAGPGGRVRIALRRTQAEVEIRVWDSAGSIAPADLARIFEPFFTTKRGGTGLGLSTAHSIVHAHGGMIHVSSSQEQGTEFVVGLPLDKEAV